MCFTPPVSWMNKHVQGGPQPVSRSGRRLQLENFLLVPSSELSAQFYRSLKSFRKKKQAGLHPGLSGVQQQHGPGVSYLNLQSCAWITFIKRHHRFAYQVGQVLT